MKKYYAYVRGSNFSQFISNLNKNYRGGIRYINDWKILLKHNIRIIKLKKMGGDLYIDNDNFPPGFPKIFNLYINPRNNNSPYKVVDFLKDNII